MTRLDKKILKAQETVRELKRQKLEAQKAEQSKKEPAKRGRKQIPEKKLKEIEAEAYLNPLPFVAFKFNVSLSTLYNHGITREALNAKANLEKVGV